ncbi:caldesmon-like [Clytia hemisphaerica]|uniref:caldesmon-like n=1 Tax=Clytia hemisphaerica TaxID=252671 RepID=UPI0034D4164F
MAENLQENIEKSKRKPPMSWTAQHEEMLLREILTWEPFNHKLGSTGRGESWKMIAETLNSLDNPKFTVTHRSVREKYANLEKEHKKKMADEERASGDSPEGLTDKEKALDEIVQRFADIELSTEKNRQVSAKAIEKERASAVEVRKQAMETYSETKRRSEDESPTSSSKGGKRRRSSDDTMLYLRDKMEMDRAFRDRELKVAETRENTMQQLLVQQQQQNQAMLALLLNQNNSGAQ